MIGRRSRAKATSPRRPTADTAASRKELRRDQSQQEASSTLVERIDHLRMQIDRLTDELHAGHEGEADAERGPGRAVEERGALHHCTARQRVSAQSAWVTGDTSSCHTRRTMVKDSALGSCPVPGETACGRSGHDPRNRWSNNDDPAPDNGSSPGDVVVAAKGGHVIDLVRPSALVEREDPARRGLAPPRIHLENGEGEQVLNPAADEEVSRRDEPESRIALSGRPDMRIRGKRIEQR